jgi:hypothetical protein
MKWDFEIDIGVKLISVEISKEWPLYGDSND